MRIKTTKRKALIGALLSSALLFGFAAPAQAAPTWRIDAIANPTATEGELITYVIAIQNVGDASAPEEIVGNEENCTPGALAPPAVPENCYEVIADFPDGIVPLEVLANIERAPGEFVECPIGDGANTVTCQVDGDSTAGGGAFDPQIDPLQVRTIEVTAEVTAPSGTQTTALEVHGAGAGTKSISHSIEVEPEAPDFGIAKFDGRIGATQSGGHLAQAGAHAYDFSTTIEVDSFTNPDPIIGSLWPPEAAKDIVVDLPPGFVGNPTAADRCSAAELAHMKEGEDGSVSNIEPAPLCPSSSQVGVTYIHHASPGYPLLGPVPVYSMDPPTGSPARFGFNVLGTVVMLDAELRSDSDYGISVVAHNIVQALSIQGSEVTIWGVPSDQSHDNMRACPGELVPQNGGPTCPSGAPDIPFFRNPTSCTNPGEGLPFEMRTDSWQNPGDFETASFKTHEEPGYPADPSLWGAEKGIEGCEKVPVKAKLKAQPSSIETETPTGLEVHVEIPDPHPGPENPEGIAPSDIKAVKVTLPAGVTINPSQAEGLGVCTPSQYESTELSFFPTPGKGCPSDSKIGTVLVKTPLLEETIPGDVYVAQQDDPSTTQKGAENPFDSLLAIYVVLEEPNRGVLVKLAGKVETDEKSGRIVTTFDDIPQQPFESFDFKFREGARAPLVTPPTCGSYETEALFTPWSAPNTTLKSTSSFQITRGIGGAPCPQNGTPSFKPGFTAGSINNNAGSFSPFFMRLTRNDGEQDLTKFSSVLPPGVVAKIAGVERCSETAIASAKTKTGRQELANPSCPLNSQIGRSLAGAGVGSVLTYVPGKIYLAGPWNGAPLSVVAITPAVAGPFDVGTVLVREALTLDPKTAEVHVDGERSDPIPHILKGIPLKLRDLRVYVDRQSFTLNPTSCDPSQVLATLWGSNANVFDPADDSPIGLGSRFQAANCSSLGFKPNLNLNLKGGTKRGGHPALKAVLTPRAKDANLEGAIVKLPRSAFLDQAHIRTVCTRVQFAADACPPGAIYGNVTAFSPLLDEPLKGPAYLRSSDNKLPDLVFDLHGIVDIETSARIDSVNGGIRATFPFVPDAPISKVIVEMQGGKKGLIVNSRDLCAARSRADVKLDAQNGKVSDFRAVLRAGCGEARKGKRPRG